MRENIGLYRGKRKDNGEWIEGYYIHLNVNADFICQGRSFNSLIPINIEIIPETVGEYTGLTDKNNKMIFEGDIVEFKRFNYEYIGKIAFDEKSCTFAIYFDTVVGAYGEKATHTMFISYADNVTIIGNIHDNSELLKGGVE